MSTKTAIAGTVLALVLAAPNSLHAEQAQDFIERFKAEAIKDDPAFAGFDAVRGENFFKTQHSDWSCATCHTEDPRQPGKHVMTEKTLKPLAPAANADRFTNPKKVDKWFRRNCKDVVKRECSAREKGDVLTYLLGLKP